MVLFSGTKSMVSTACYFTSRFGWGGDGIYDIAWANENMAMEPPSVNTAPLPSSQVSLSTVPEPMQMQACQKEGTNMYTLATQQMSSVTFSL
jgi:hypothetical protein